MKIRECYPLETGTKRKADNSEFTKYLHGVEKQLKKFGSLVIFYNEFTFDELMTYLINSFDHKKVTYKKIDGSKYVYIGLEDKYIMTPKEALEIVKTSCNIAYKVCSGDESSNDKFLETDEEAIKVLERVIK